MDRLDVVKHVRHDTVHLKSRDAYPRSETPVTGFFHRLLSFDSRSFPRTSVDVMLHFDTSSPMWLKAANDVTSRTG